ncbi:transposase [Ancylobacter oerskovii]|nr:transposase [Ancylobacter oerskovii]
MYSGRWPDYRDGTCKYRAGSIDVSLGARVRCLAWAPPKSHSSGGKDRLGRISKRGDRYIRHLLYVGAGNVIRFAKARAASGEHGSELYRIDGHQRS